VLWSSGDDGAAASGEAPGMKAFQLTAWQQPAELRDVPACRLDGRSVVCPNG
jgi:hypothetical protein